MSTRTLCIVKPDAVSGKSSGLIIKDIEEAGFEIIKIKKVWLSDEDAKRFYAIHSERPFFDDLVSFMISGPVIVLELNKENAVNHFRDLIGHTDPKKADACSLRSKYGDCIDANALHGSDSDENALNEIAFFFEEL